MDKRTPQLGDIKFIGTVGYVYGNKDGNYTYMPMIYSSTHVFDREDHDIGMAFEFDADKLYYNFRDGMVHHRDF